MNENVRNNDRAPSAQRPSDAYAYHLGQKKAAVHVEPTLGDLLYGLMALLCRQQPLDAAGAVQARESTASTDDSKPSAPASGGAGKAGEVQAAVRTWVLQTLEFGQALQSGLRSCDDEQTSAVLHEKVGSMLAGIHSEGMRDALRLNLSELLERFQDSPATIVREQTLFVGQIASLGIWSYHRVDGAAYAECEEPADGFLDSHCCLMEVIELARRIGEVDAGRPS